MPLIELRYCNSHGATNFRHQSSGDRWRCILCTNGHKNSRRKRLKELFVLEHGGACTVCGYNRSMRALHFHHVDPTTKKFGVAQNWAGKSEAQLRSELDKCTLLCSNCHAEAEDQIAESSNRQDTTL